MTYVYASLIVVWICGLLFLVGVCMNDLRLVFNNLAPGATGSPPPRRDRVELVDHAIGIAPFVVPHPVVFLAATLLHISRLTRLDRIKSNLFSSMNPAELNEAGRGYLEAGIKHERMLMVWAIAGFIMLIFVVPRLQAS